MKCRYILLVPIALVLVQVGSAIAVAQPTRPTPDSQHNQPNEAPVPPWARDLNLSAAQRSQLQSVNEQARKNGAVLHQKLMAAEEQLRSLLQSDVSIEQLRQQYREVQKLRQQLDNNRFEALLGERQVLTSAQLKKVIERFRNPSPVQ